MAFANCVKISGRFLRSVRVDLDANSSSLDGYIFTGSLKETLLNMAAQQSGSSQSAYTWTGPYGSGKSSLALVVTSLLSGTATSRNSAVKQIADEAFTNSFLAALPPKKSGWKILSLVGELDSPAKTFAKGLREKGWVDSSEVSSDKAVIEALQKVSNSNSKNSGGLIVVLDEMGKFLENALSDTSSIFFFQLLAEAASRSNGRLVVIGILHQAFQEYASRQAREIRDEWAKIQGRFSDIPVNISGEEQVELIGKAIITKGCPKSSVALAKRASKFVQSHRPHFGKSAAKSLNSVWPLNPITALLLGPISRRSYGQNQRSIFSFLSSSEKFGFQEFLHNETDLSLLYNPADLWDYIQFNLQSSIAVSADSHHFSNATEAIERCVAADGSEIEVDLLKNIALLELTRQHTGFGASQEALELSMPSVGQKSISDALNSLREKSLIIYRKFRGSFGISEGSDFDLESALQESKNEIDAVNLDAISSSLSISLVSAKRHYHETGTMRWCNFAILPVEGLNQHISKLQNNTLAFGLISLVLPTNDETQKEIIEVIKNAQSNVSGLDLIIATSKSARQLVSLAKEHSALEYLLGNYREIDRDKIARREINDRIEAIISKIENEVWRSLDEATWFAGSNNGKPATWAEVNAQVSDLADARFPDAPRVFNELLNRSKPSSSANGALKRLLHAMVLREGEKQLGIDKYPAEKGLFCSIIEPNGLHKKTARGWHFVAPKPNNSNNLFLLWERTRKYLNDNGDKNIELTEIYDLWRSEPFGVREGLLPLFAVLFFITDRSSLAFYRDGVFLSSFSDVDVDYLLKAPKSIQIRWMNLSSVSRNLMASLADVVAEITGKQVLNLEPLDLARELISAFESAAPWVHRTSRLSMNALKIRILFKRSRDPNKFLFDDIPNLYADHTNISTSEGIEYVTHQIRDGLLEILGRYPEMLKSLRDQVLAELQVHTQSPQAIKELNERANNIKGISGDLRLDAFIGRLASFDNSLESIESLVSIGINKPARSWADNDVDRALVSLVNFSQSFVKLETVARVKGRKDKRDSMAVVVGMDGRPAPVVQEFDVMESDWDQVYKISAKLRKALASQGNIPQNIALAALATVSAHVINLDETTPKKSKKNV